MRCGHVPTLMFTSMKNKLPLLVVACASALAAAESPHAISAASILARTKILASDEFEGRGPATPGEEKTVSYLVSEFKKLGLQPGNPDGTFIQNAHLVGITSQPTLSFTVGGQPMALENINEFVAFSTRVQPHIEGRDRDVVFVGYGIVAPEFGWDDYKGVDVRGKTVVMLINDPPVVDPATGKLDPKVFGGAAMTYYGRWTYKYEEAMSQGADAALLVHQTGPAAYGWDVVRNSNTGPLLEPDSADGHAGRVAIEGWMTLETTRRIFSLAGFDFGEMEQAATKPGFRAVPLGVSASVAVRNAVRRATSANVVGVLPGSRHPEEYVVYMAHWDHFGKSLAVGPQNDGIYNGAVDNATGVAGILEIAKAFRAGKRPDRTVVFLAVTAEEQGLLGSAYYAQHPVFPLAMTAAAINIDALPPVGRTRDVEVLGFGASQLEDYLKEAAARTHRVLRPDSQPEKGYFFRSDHFNLSKVGVPSLYIKPGIDSIDHPAGWVEEWQHDYVANRYHKPSDEYSASWDVSGSIDDLRLLFEVGHRVADERLWPEWYADSEFRAAREASRRPAAH